MIYCIPTMKRYPIALRGLPFVFLTAATSLVSFVFAGPAAGSLFAAVTLFMIWFFRFPAIEENLKEDAIYSPAEGTLIGIRAMDPPYGFRIDIFMSVFNVHINYTPVSGRVELVRYRRGKKGHAGREEASLLNESNLVEISTSRGPVAMKQIAGTLARRIVFEPVAGDEVRLGQPVGMIMFGSRVEAMLPPNAEILVKKGDTVRGGKTVIARWS